MRDIIVLIILVVLITAIFIRSFEPKIDITQTGPNKYRVLLWYNSFEGATIHRKWIKVEV